jgi:hypothetical protein
MQPIIVGGKVYGPYAHRHRWRVVVLDSMGRRSAQVCETYEEANELVARLDAELTIDTGLRVESALDRYRDHLGAQSSESSHAVLSKTSGRSARDGVASRSCDSTKRARGCEAPK